MSRLYNKNSLKNYFLKCVHFLSRSIGLRNSLLVNVGWSKDYCFNLVGYSRELFHDKTFKTV